MEPLKIWLRLVKASYTIDQPPATDPIVNAAQINDFRITQYTIVPTDGWERRYRRLVVGEPAFVSRADLSVLYADYMSCLNLELFHPEANKHDGYNRYFNDENLCRLVDEIRAEGDVPVVELQKIPDDVFKKIFYDSLFLCRGRANPRYQRIASRD